MSTNTIFTKIAVATTAYSLSRLRKITYEDMISKFGLTSDEVRDIGPYHSGIQRRLVRNVLEANKEQAMNEMVNKFLLSGTAITTEEARLAVEKIFEGRSK